MSHDEIFHQKKITSFTDKLNKWKQFQFISGRTNNKIKYILTTVYKLEQKQNTNR